MSDEQQAPEFPDTPEIDPAFEADTSVPDAETHQSIVDWENRYNSLRPEWDRQNQLLAAARSGDPEAIRALGFEVDEPEPEYIDDPVAQLRAELKDEIRREVSQFQSQQQQRDSELASAAALHAIDGFESVPETLQDMIWVYAQSLPQTENGLYDVEAAYDRFLSGRTADQKSWAQTKASAPTSPPAGQAATDVPLTEDMSPAELAKWATEAYRDRSR